MEEEQLFKIVITGNSAVGKSSLLFRLCDDTFRDMYLSTIGVDFRFRTLTVDGSSVKLQIWDTAGQERFRTITSSYYKGAQGIAIVFDLTNKKSFEDIARYWLKEVRNFGDADIVMLLIGNKTDLAADEQTRQVSYEEANKFANDNGLKYFEVSAKTAEQVADAFQEFARMILVKWKENQGLVQKSKSLFSMQTPEEPANNKPWNQCC